MTNPYAKLTLVVTTLLAHWGRTTAGCYFPQEFQGDFVMQSTASVGTGIQYATVNVTATSIPIWGNCHRRIGNNFILMLNFGETSCVRCLHLKLRSSSVLQVFALNQEIISKCYTSQEVAEANCPSEQSLTNREAAEILLFKTKEANGAYPKREYCPIDGEFLVKYRNNNAMKRHECLGFNSTMGTCPSGSTLTFRLRGCTFDSYDLKLECLGSWKGPRNENFIVFIDNRQSNGQKPKYRCGLYSQDYHTGEIRMALSRDSTCNTDLVSSAKGFETFILSLKSENPWPAEASSGICSFPKWMHGNWEHVRVDENTIIYKDHSSFKTYTIKCVGIQENEDKYLIFSRSQCGEENYNCMRILNRSDNILEFQLGSNVSSTQNVFELCSDENFHDDDTWITQGRTDILQGMPSGQCPISGVYVGVIPDSTDLCAKLWSDCNTSDLMYYQVSQCKTHEIFEEREYRCLGHWRESKFLYTYTQRRDVAAGTYECFVGVKISSKEIYIREAGEHCQRNIDPLHYGMQLNQTSSYPCNYTTQRNPVNVRTTTSTPRRATTPSLPTQRPTTRIWNFDDAGAETRNTKESPTSSSCEIEPTLLAGWTLILLYRLY